MGMRTYTIELRVDDSVPDEIIRQAGREVAKHFYAAAVLVSGKRAPDIAFHSSDFFEGAQEINIDDPTTPTT